MGAFGKLKRERPQIWKALLDKLRGQERGVLVLEADREKLETWKQNFEKTCNLGEAAGELFFEPYTDAYLAHLDTRVEDAAEKEKLKKAVMEHDVENEALFVVNCTTSLTSGVCGSAVAWTIM